MTAHPESFDGLPSVGVLGGSVVDRVHDALRTAIVAGELEPGRRLREIPLSQHFGVSTTPIREALRRLGYEGLVRVEPRRGAVVASFDTSRVTELYEIREVLESHAVRRAAAREDRNLAAVEAVLADSERLVTKRSPDPLQVNEIDVLFHRTLGALGGNAELAAVAESVHRQIQAVRVRALVHLPDRPRIAHQEHLRIVAAVRKGDADRAARLVAGHIASVRKAVLEVLKRER